MQIHLSPDQMRFASRIGCERQIQNLVEGRKNRFGARISESWNLTIEGAMAEYAVALTLGVPWDGALGNLKAADVLGLPVRVQVRSTGHTGGKLILHPTDPDLDYYILVTGHAPSFTIRGCIMGADGKKGIYWDDPQGGRPAYFVPQDKLRPFEELIDLIEFKKAA